MKSVGPAFLRVLISILIFTTNEILSASCAITSDDSNICSCWPWFGWATTRTA